MSEIGFVQFASWFRSNGQGLH